MFYIPNLHHTATRQRKQNIWRVCVAFFTKSLRRSSKLNSFRRAPKSCLVTTLPLSYSHKAIVCANPIPEQRRWSFIVMASCLVLGKHHYVISSVFCFLQTLFARALYANTAETEDELAFCKGEIIMVLEKNVVGSTGWWKCALRGRQGLAPANRLAPLSPAEAEQIAAERECSTNHNHQSIYQTPIALSKSPAMPIYEDMKTVYKVPPQGICSPNKQKDPEGTRPLHDVSLVTLYFMI